MQSQILTGKAAPNPFDHFAIQNVIAKYAIALDTKQFDLLLEVFTEDVDTIYPFKGQIKGAKEVADAIQKRLTPVTSQHALTTQTINVGTGNDTAKATTYFTGIHFGKGKWEGQQVTAWGKYVDELVLVEGAEETMGASGAWRIFRREVTFMGRLGEEGVMEAD